VYAVGVVDWEVEVRLGRWLRLVRQYGVEPVVVRRPEVMATAAGRRLVGGWRRKGWRVRSPPLGCGMSNCGRWIVREGEGREVREVLERVRPALVHTMGLLPIFGEVCRGLGLAHVASLYAVGDDDARWPGALGAVRHCGVNHSDSLRYADRWREWLGSERFCGREVVAQESFDLGLRRHLEGLGTDALRGEGRVRVVVLGTVCEEAGQLEAIAAMAEASAAGIVPKIGGRSAIGVCFLCYAVQRVIRIGDGDRGGAGLVGRGRGLIGQVAVRVVNVRDGS